MAVFGFNPNLSYMWWLQFWAGLLVVFPISILILSEVVELFVRHFFRPGESDDEKEEEGEEEDRDGLANYVVNPLEASYTATDQTMTNDESSYSQRRHAKRRHRSTLYQKRAVQMNGEKKKRRKKRKKKKTKVIEDDYPPVLFDEELDSKKNM